MNFVAFHRPPVSGARAAPGLVGVRVYLDSLGCPKNLVDSEAALGMLLGKGCIHTSNPDQADILVVNTCGFLESAREESIERILELAQLKSHGRPQLLAVLGCLVARAAEELSESMPEVDLWLPAGRHGELPARLASLWRDRRSVAVRQASDRSGSGRAPITAFAGFGRRALLTPAHTAYLKISEGCSNACTFCSIPLMRGSQRSRSIASVQREARELAARGVREIHLVAQDSTHYGFDLRGRPDLVDLVGALSEVEGLEWIRLLYAHPAHLTRRMLRELFAVPKVVRYLDVPIQHASRPILRAMRRPYSPDRVRAQCAELRERFPTMVLRTTVIVGFPGETERDFERLCRFVEEVRFDRLGIFTYSREPGTPAASRAGRPRSSTASRRLQTLTDLQMHIAAERAAERIGTQVRVLVDGRVPAEDRASIPLARGAAAIGRSEGEALDIDGSVYIEPAARSGDLEPGRFVWSEIVDADVHDLRARPLPAPPGGRIWK